MMENVILIGILLTLAGVVGGYLLRRKKCGSACMGCPHAGKCPSGGSEGL